MSGYAYRRCNKKNVRINRKARHKNNCKGKSRKKKYD